MVYQIIESDDVYTMCCGFLMQYEHCIYDIVHSRQSFYFNFYWYATTND